MPHGHVVVPGPVPIVGPVRKGKGLWSKLEPELTDEGVMLAGAGGALGLVLGVQFLPQTDRAIAGIIGGAVGSGAGYYAMKLMQKHGKMNTTELMEAVGSGAVGGILGGMIAQSMQQGGIAGSVIGGVTIYLTNAVARAYL
jgi:hypothetical protein